MAAAFLLTEDSPMDFKSTLQTIAGYLPDDFRWQDLVSGVTSQIPAEINFVSSLEFLVFFFVGMLIMGSLGRLAMGKRSDLNHAVSSAMGILCIYAVTVAIYTFQPHTLTDYLSPLPFVTLAGDYLIFLPFRGMAFSFICTQVLSLVILAFLVNLLDTFIPKGENAVSWYLLRFVTVVLAMGAHYVVHWAFNAFLPMVLVTYAPMILLGILAGMLLLSVLNLVLGVVLTMIDPIFGGIYAFFFSNIVGKQLTKAVLTTALICGVFFLLETMGYATIVLSAAALASCVPLVIVLLILWYLLGHVL